MTRRFGYRLALYFPLALCLLARPEGLSAEPEPVRAGIVLVRIEANAAVYHLGEKIRLRVTLINNTDQVYAIVDPPPAFGTCDLLIIDGAGRAVPPVDGSWPYRVLQLAADLPARIEQVAWSYDPDNGFAHTEWTDIKFWGYKLTQPGRYTIYALPALELFERIGGRTGPYFLTSPADKSNAVQIEIVK
jgi:hypothetical protein